MSRISSCTFTFSACLIFLSLLPESFCQGMSIPQKNNADNIPYLSCNTLSQRSKEFLHYHYVYRSWNPELTRRTFTTLFKTLDPAKTYFLKSDIQSFQKYEEQIGSLLSHSRCQFMNDIYKLYVQRIHEYTIFARKQLEEKLPLSAHDTIETDRKKVKWAEDNQELQKRQINNLKFVLYSINGEEPSHKSKMRLIKRLKGLDVSVKNRSTDEIYSILLNSFAQSLDPHSSFLTPVDNASFKIDFSLKLVGIGATLMNIDGFTTIDAIVPGGAAAKSGLLMRGDRITAVNPDGKEFRDVIDMELEKVVQMIRGQKDTPVQLAILRTEPNGKVKNFKVTLTRSLVEIKDSEAKGDVLKVGADKIGVIQLPSFYIDYQGCQLDPVHCRSSSNDMARAVHALEKEHVKGIIVDLRRNGGGDLNEVKRIVGLFIDNPIVTQVRARRGPAHSLSMRTQAIYDGPLEVLTSRFSASASEILAGAIQDYGRGLIVGDSSTFGKGTVQTVIELPGTGKRNSNGAIHVTIAKFFRPSGQSNQATGIPSDIVIPSATEAFEKGEKGFDYFLPNTTISPAPHFERNPDFCCSPQVTEKLRQKSRERVKKSKDFHKILKLLKKEKKESSSTLVTLKSLMNDAGKNKKTLNKKSTADILKNLPDFSPKVIKKDDHVLFEAGNILHDEIQLQKSGNP